VALLDGLGRELSVEAIQSLVAGFRREDDAPIPEIAVPVSVPNQWAVVGMNSAARPREQAVGDLSLIAFYYLLRVGEYTQ